MKPTSLPGLPLLVSAIVLLSIDLSQALAQGSGVVNPPQTALPLNVSQSKVVEADGTAIVNLQVQFAFASLDLADAWDGQRPLTVGYTTENGTARAGTCGTAGADYVATTGTVQFTGQLSQAANIQICSDDLSEGDEQFGLRLTATENHPTSSSVSAEIRNSLRSPTTSRCRRSGSRRPSRSPSRRPVRRPSSSTSLAP